MMFRRIISGLCLLAGCLAADAADTSARPPAVYFIGDSFLGSGGGSQRHTEALFKAAGIPVRIESRIYGSTHMGGHLNTPADLQKLQEGGFTHVIFVAGCRPSKHPNRRGMMEHYGARLVETARAAGVIPVLFMHQELRGETGLYQAMIGYHTAFADRHGILRAPCFPAWLAALKESPELPLWDKDNAHQSVHGAYMNACVFYSLLTGTSPEGNTYVPKEISPEDAALIQRVAWQTWKATPQPEQREFTTAPLAVAGITAAAQGEIRIAFNGPLHSRTLKNGKWTVSGAAVGGARLSDDARTLILSTPELSAGSHQLVLSGIEPCREGLGRFSTGKPLDFSAAATPDWYTCDTGHPRQLGRFTGGAGAVSLTASAVGKIGGAPADEIFFVYRILDGDGEITARLSRISETIPPYPYEIVGRYRRESNPYEPAGISATGGAGLMLRAGDSATAQMFCVVQTASRQNGTPGAEKIQSTARIKTGGPAAPADGQGAGVIPAPVWLKVVRKGDVFESFHSADGSTWSLLGTVALPGAPPRMMAGLFAYAGEFFAEVQADFEQIRVAAYPAQPAQ